jgi:formylglycine-generating enzyme required for sulfatase activity
MALESLTLHYYERTHDSYTLDLGDGIDLTLMLIPAGEFMMGARADDTGAYDDERPQHPVQLNQFLIGATPITQAQWRVVAGYDKAEIDLEADPSNFKGDDLPVEGVNWYEAVEFCQRLSNKTGKHFHLPSEAQWEYACRAGTETPYHFGPQITNEVANYNRDVGQTTAVKSYPPNRWGLYDMHGNVREWCEDDWHDNYEGAPSDGSAWLDATEQSQSLTYDGTAKYDGSRTYGGEKTIKNKVRRGGSWRSSPRGCRSAYRFNNNSDNRNLNIGFRVSCSPPRILQ